MTRDELFARLRAVRDSHLSGVTLDRDALEIILREIDGLPPSPRDPRDRRLFGGPL